MPRKINEAEDAKLANAMAAALKAARMRAGLTQEEVATRAGTVTEVYGRIERGHAIPSIPMLLAIGRALGAEPNELLGATPVAEKQPKRSVLHRLVSDVPDTWAARKLLRNISGLSPSHTHTLAQLASQLRRK